MTKDLGGFWAGSYAEVRREMRGRYPKHYWPEDPLAAEPSAHSIRRKPPAPPTPPPAAQKTRGKK